MPYKIISDNDTQFEGKTFEEYCKERGIRRSFSAVVHLQDNGQVEAINKVLKKNLKTKLEKMKGAWVEELPNVLWAYRTTPHTTTREAPFSLAYGCEAVLLIEMKVNSFRIYVYEDQVNHAAMAESLDMLEKRREKAQMRVAVYQHRAARYYNSRVQERTFRIGDLVLRKVLPNARDPGEGVLRASWEGPLPSRSIHTTKHL